MPLLLKFTARSSKSSIMLEVFYILAIDLLFTLLPADYSQPRHLKYILNHITLTQILSLTPIWNWFNPQPNFLPNP